MDRSLYPEGVEVRQADLQNTEDTRAFHILQRTIDNSSTGVVTGLLVTPTNTTVNISAGYGYCPKGEFVELLSSITGIALADYTAGVKNYILLVYTETNSEARPHKSSGDSVPTQANRSYRLTVLTETAYNALPESDSNFDNDSLDRALVVAVVTAQGSGVDLIATNIELSSAFGGGTTAVISGNLPGVSIIRISDDTPSGTGTLDYVNATDELTWTAPGDTSGVAQNVATGGVFALVSQPSEVTLTVLISDALLPVVDTNVPVTVTNIYKQNVLRHSALDTQHRSFIGSGIPKANNPHGLTPGDLGLGETQTEFHQQVFHSNAVTSDSAPDFLKPTVYISTVPHRIQVVAPTAGDSVYIGGFPHQSINGTFITFTDIVEDVQALFDIYAIVGTGNGIADFGKYERMRYDDDPPPDIAAVCQLRDLSDNHPVGAGVIQYISGAETLAYQAPGDSMGPAFVIQSSWQRETQRLYSDNPDYWIDVFVRAQVYWGGVATVDEDVTINPQLTDEELADRLLLCRTVFSGVGTGFLGNGFDSFFNSPNEPNEKRRVGTSGYDRIGSDVGQIHVREVRGVSFNHKYNFSEYPLMIKSESALSDGPRGEAGVLTVYNGELWFWNGTSWQQIS
jgi:hypothetical protein